MSEGHTERLEAALAGRYRIEKKLGEGGMASVYLAEDLKHERKVALKILRPELAAVIGAERFLTEIKTTANLQHPHILPLFDSGEASEFLYYVMPFIDGETLRDKLDREKQLGVDESIRIAKDVADALDYAHRHGVIHRDIKPGNILLHDGRPVVADFGIALAVSAAGGGRMTETGLSLGTPHYMSPEQASADRDLSARSDVYSLGCVLYEMIAGQPPHTGRSAQSILVHILTKDVTPLTELRHTVPPHVAAAVSKSIEKLPADRFERAKQFIEALEDEGFAHKARPGEGTAILEPEVAGPPLGRRRPRDLLLTAAAAVALTVGAMTAFGALRPPSPATSVVFALDHDGMGSADRDHKISRDGSMVVTSAPGQGGLYLRRLDELDFRPVMGPEQPLYPAFSPDGNWIVYVELGDGPRKLMRMSLAGGGALTLYESSQGRAFDPHWGEDGTIVFYLEAPERGIYRVPSVGGGGAERISELDGRNPFVLPDGSGALAAAGDGGIHFIDLRSDSFPSWEIIPEGEDPSYVETGHILYSHPDGGLFAVPFDLRRHEVTGPPARVLDDVRSRGFFKGYSVSRNGTLVYGVGGARGRESQLVVVDLEGNEEVLVLPPRPINTVSWAPDGRSVTYASEPEGGGPRQIFTYDVVLNTAPRQLTFDGDNFNPVFSPDGTRVAFSSGREGTDGVDLFVKNLNDDLPPRSIITLEANQLVTQWPSDSLIVFETGANNNRDLWTVDLSDPENPTAAEYLGSEARLQYVVVSPDGTLAAYMSNESGQPEVYIRSFPQPGAPTKVSQDGGNIPFWSPDGSTLYYARGNLSVATFFAAHTQREALPVVPRTEELFTIDLASRPFQGSGLHPDGDRFILARLVGTTESESGEAEQVGFIVVTNWFERLLERMGEN